MSEKPAARLTDAHSCTQPDHTGQPIVAPGAMNTIMAEQPAARIGDFATCLVKGLPVPADIVSGAMPVRIEGKPAAVKDSKTAHGGKVTQGLDSVLIGLAGTSGNVLAGKEACRAAAAGRNPPKDAKGPFGSALKAKTAGQSYNNCGLEASRQLINTAGPQSVSQEDLLKDALKKGLAYGPDTSQHPNLPKSEQLYYSGGTVSTQREAVLNNYGVPATVAPQASLSNLTDAIADGRSAVAAVWTGRLQSWKFNYTSFSGKYTPGDYGGHALLVTGVKYDADGKPVAVVVNDTGLGVCGEKIPISEFKKALIKDEDFVLTKNPVW